MNWQEYQKVVAKLFRKLGCLAIVNATVKGARAKHKIDAWVTFKKFGITNRWVVECKKWRTRVSKEKILALKSIIEDIGADRGLLITEIGFQKGAVKAAKNTNITLTKLVDLEKHIQGDIYSLAINKLDKKIIQLQDRIFNLRDYAQTGPDSFMSSPKPSLNGNEQISMGGQVAILEMRFKDFKKRNFPIIIDYGNGGEKIFIAKNCKDFLQISSIIIKKVDKWVKKQEGILKNYEINKK